MDPLSQPPDARDGRHRVRVDFYVRTGRYRTVCPEKQIHLGETDDALASVGLSER